MELDKDGNPIQPNLDPEDKKIKGIDPDAEIPSATQEKIKRWGEQMAGFNKGIENLAVEMKAIKESLSQKPESTPEKPTFSDDDKPYVEYYKKLGFVNKEEVDKMFQERIAPLTEGQKTTQKAEQQRILNDFIKDHPELSKEEDIAGEKMGKIIEKLRRVAPAVPGNPNYSLKEDLELAYNWAHGKSDLEEFRQKAKATGAAAALQALETQVGGGSSIITSPKEKSLNLQQEALVKKWGVDDETLNNKKYPNKE